MSAALKLVVFDMDGTLIDSQVLILEAMRRGFEDAGLAPPSDAEILSIVGLSLPEAVRALRPAMDAEQAPHVAEGYKRNFIRLREEMGGEAAAPMYPGARDALDRLATHDHVLMGVATGKARRGLNHAFRAHDLGRYFLTSQTADEHPSKPHPSMLEAALFETGTEARAGVMIGDTEFDVAMAKSAGMAAIGVAWGYHPVSRLRAAGADVVIETFEALDAALQEIWETRR